MERVRPRLDHRRLLSAAETAALGITLAMSACRFDPSYRDFPDPVFDVCTEGVVECNGTRDVGWYRKATVFGHTTVEWPIRRKPPVKGVVTVRKPLSTNCDCWLNDRIPVLRVGRYGKWQKGYLTHHVVADVEKALGTLQTRLF